VNGRNKRQQERQAENQHGRKPQTSMQARGEPRRERSAAGRQKRKPGRQQTRRRSKNAGRQQQNQQHGAAGTKRKRLAEKNGRHPVRSEWRQNAGRRRQQKIQAGRQVVNGAAGRQAQNGRSGRSARQTQQCAENPGGIRCSEAERRNGRTAGGSRNETRNAGRQKRQVQVAKIGRENLQNGRKRWQQAAGVQ